MSMSYFIMVYVGETYIGLHLVLIQVVTVLIPIRTEQRISAKNQRWNKSLTIGILNTPCKSIAVVAFVSNIAQLYSRVLRGGVNLCRLWVLAFVGRLWNLQSSACGAGGG